MQPLQHYIRHPKDILIGLLHRATCLLPDALYLRLMFRLKMGYRLDLKNPRTFNEKLQWLKLHDRNPDYTRLVDKIAVKEYVAGVLGEEVIIPTLGVWEHFDDIDFDTLPEQFVLKTNHSGGSTGVAICSDRASFDFATARRMLEASLRRNTYTTTKEWPYKGVRPRILAEKYMGDTSAELVEYKFWCFDGRVADVFICEGRFSAEGVFFNHYDRDWKRLYFSQDGPCNDVVRPRPKLFDRMLEYAERLAAGYPHVRIDLYSDEAGVYFGEITFFDSSGYGRFDPPAWDLRYGELIDLTRVKTRSVG